MVTEVQTGEIMTITAQSDAIEFSGMVETANSKGHTGKIDGAMTGLYMSEPRDLMVTLLSQGSSAFREVIAQATRGAIFLRTGLEFDTLEPCFTLHLTTWK